jgi:hypothetical protein
MAGRKNATTRTINNVPGVSKTTPEILHLYTGVNRRQARPKTVWEWEQPG